MLSAIIHVYVKQIYISVTVSLIYAEWVSMYSCTRFENLMLQKKIIFKYNDIKNTGH